VCAQQLDGGDGGGIAGHHQRLGPLRDKEAGNRQRALGNDLFRLVAVGRERGIGEIQQMLMRQLGADVAQHRQAAHTRVEHPDRGVCRHAHLSLTRR
jgi:hypothetical protein